MSRYTIEGPWREEESRLVTDYNLENQWTITKETATLMDNHGGMRYECGAYRVRVKGPNPPRTKTFRGETAWSDAERLMGDWCIELARR